MHQLLNLPLLEPIWPPQPHEVSQPTRKHDTIRGWWTHMNWWHSSQPRNSWLKNWFKAEPPWKEPNYSRPIVTYILNYEFLGCTFPTPLVQTSLDWGKLTKQVRSQPFRLQLHAPALKCFACRLVVWPTRMDPNLHGFGGQVPNSKPKIISKFTKHRSDMIR